MCLHIFHGAQAAGTAPVHLQERNQTQTEQLEHSPAAGLEKASAERTRA